MTMATHQMQGSYALFPSRPVSWNRGTELKQFLATVHMVVKTDRLPTLKCRSSLSVGPSLFQGPNAKYLRILCFKGSAQNDESGGRASRSKTAKDAVKLSYVPQDSDKTLTEPSKMQDVPLSYTSEATERTAGSMAIQKLFKYWLALLRTQPINQVMEETLEDPPSKEIAEAENEAQQEVRHEILKIFWCYFWSLDATLKIPLLIFIPWFLVVNVVYGAEISKELTPLWVVGPLILTLYIKMFQGLCALYVFTFKQTAKVVRNLPTYSLVAYNYIAQGKLEEDIRAHFWQPLVDIKNLDYKELSRRKMKDFEVWAIEKYLDFVESIWPYYCRTIRFLKRANLI